MFDELFDVLVIPLTELSLETVFRDEPLCVGDRVDSSNQALLMPFQLEPEDFWVVGELVLRFVELFVSSDLEYSSSPSSELRFLIPLDTEFNDLDLSQESAVD
jgi:hypothetical protein